MLSAGQNAYSYTVATRRDCDVIADVFQSENPVIYNAYTKGDVRADAFLRNQKLTDSRLFIGYVCCGGRYLDIRPESKNGYCLRAESRLTLCEHDCSDVC